MHRIEIALLITQSRLPVVVQSRRRRLLRGQSTRHERG